MKILISPAKSIDIQPIEGIQTTTIARFLDESEGLVKKLRKFSAKKIEKMMHVSRDIAELNHHRFQNWERPESPKEDIQPAIACFTGEVYRGLDIRTLSQPALEKTQESLRILSGLYGILKPFDLMYPYRLEMGTSWAVTPKTKNLYQFWGKKLANSLNEEMLEGECIINLASSEYFKAIDRKTLKHRMITPVFKELKNGEFKIVMTYAKNARGKMTRFILENNLLHPEEIKGFDVDGYRYHERLSSDDEWVFTR